MFRKLLVAFVLAVSVPLVAPEPWAPATAHARYITMYYVSGSGPRHTGIPRSINIPTPSYRLAIRAKNELVKHYLTVKIGKRRIRV